MSNIPFAKAHGFGNDFVIVNVKDLPNGLDIRKLALKISNRRTGIGCDQFLVYSDEGDFCETFIYNADGSKASACGNGSRCVAKFVALRSKKNKIKLKVGDRFLDASLSEDGSVTVNMGKAYFEAAWVLPKDKILELSELYSVNFKEVICVDVGNPHIVIFGDLGDSEKDLFAKRLWEKDMFPDGVNVNFAFLREGKIFLSVWERGVGPTLACASGACATFAAARKFGFIDRSAEIVFKLGTLYLESMNENIITRGEAETVAEGIYFL